jgi:N,N-dimethylformamidase
MRPADIHGYSDRLSVAPGEAIEFKVSCDRPGEYEARLVRLIHGDSNPRGPGVKETAVTSSIDGRYRARQQTVVAGSFVEVPDPDAALALQDATVVQLFVLPTTPALPAQPLLARGGGWALTLEHGRPALRVGDRRIVSDAPLHRGVWYSLAAAYDPATGAAELRHAAVINETNGLLGPAATVPGVGAARGDVGHAPVTDAPLTMAADGAARFNGKLERIALLRGRLDDVAFDALTNGMGPVGLDVIAAWDFATEIGADGVAADAVTDTGPLGLHGRCVQGPLRGVTGRLWNGREDDFRRAPEQYAAIHFHETDLEDCGWETGLRLEVPADLPSGCYAVHLRLGECEEHLPFFVLPPRGTATADVVLVMPTATYLAYANAHAHEDSPSAQLVFGHTMQLAEHDLHLYAHPEYGLSLYGLHRDGSGNSLSTALRPIVNLRPRHRHLDQWGFPADLQLVDWLTERGIGFDVVTDRELHDEGAHLLRRYRVALSPTHPEYCSERMLDAWSDYVAGGGRAMYLGANGFYWVTGFHPTKPHVIEVRRGEAGSRAWQSAPGELHLATTGERGGLWRSRGRPPQKLFGVGMAALGWDRSSPYRPLPDARDERATFIMDGIDPDALIGAFGLVGGGAAGHELDRYDLGLGTPPDALLLAASEGHSDNYQGTQEEIFFPVAANGGTENHNVRADIVYFSNDRGGGVFSTGSIAWCGSLSHEGYDNDVSRMTANVLRRFLDPDPLP